MTHDHDHGDLVGEFAQELQPLFESSTQALYLYLDDDHKVCNENFAALLGYDSPEEWAEMQGSFPQLFVEEGSHDALIHTYKNAMQNMVASTTQVSWKQKSGGTVDTNVILVPLSYQGHMFALHFISE